MINVMHIDSRKAHAIYENLDRASADDRRFFDLSRKVGLPFMKGEALTAIVRELVELGGYTAVAEVATDSLDVAYRDTNHIDRNWRENESVTALSREVRSTSVGDLFIQDGVVHVVASFGFERIDGLTDN